MKKNVLHRAHRLGMQAMLTGAIIFTAGLVAQQKGPEVPKLVVGVVVDQMRFDYLYKYQDHYTQGGFKRLLGEGYNFKNTHYNYIPTVTAAGHASIYTGAVPGVHGVVGNSWYERSSKEVVSNVGDPKVQLTGSAVANPEGRSPARLLSTTISDQLRLGTNFKSKVVSVSLKDRGAILPGGRTANAAYWHDWESSPGYFVSSTYYMEELPAWVTAFNQEERTDKYLSQTWKPLLPLSEYDESAPDDNPFEVRLRGKETPTFPYDYEEIRKLFEGDTEFYHLLWGTPFGNTLLKDFALEARRQEKLGQGRATDMLLISFSAPDIVGHTFGPHSVELQDIYLRLDRDLEDLLSTLDREVGSGNYLLFLTSDHGVVPVVSYLHDKKVSAGLAVLPKYRQDLSFYLSQTYGAFEWISYFGNEQIYLDRDLIAQRGLSLPEVQQTVADFMRKQPGVRDALTATSLQQVEYTEGIRALLQRGFHPGRSGDVLLNYEPAYLPTGNFRTPLSQYQGTSHSTGYPYDTQVPLIWFGKGIRQGSSVRRVNPTDIAPTLALILNLQMPNGAVGGTTLYELWER
ncbi:alkaline phosphatase PafA [Robiginitalea marina]|uniref:Alkaline phosphatase family protein n=1 Tax=Robiginitalea marina TaxID=2954105 RepID=A0ABT1AZV3_9FLAO|nr:alkaline phosphatase PafA [Robiginitalea marina]MCO5725581.1 alkaline phosphatase family protein [Robiginitalea marina]